MENSAGFLSCDIYGLVKFVLFYDITVNYFSKILFYLDIYEKLWTMLCALAFRHFLLSSSTPEANSLWDFNSEMIIIWKEMILLIVFQSALRRL